MENEAVKAILYLDHIAIWRERMPLNFLVLINIDIATGVEIGYRHLLSNH